MGLAEQAVDAAIKAGKIQASEKPGILAAMTGVGAPYGISVDEVAKVSLLETGIMSPKDNEVQGTGRCAGVWQACCVSLDVEMLTTRGWIKYTDIDNTTIPLTYNASRNEIEVDRVIEIFISPNPVEVIRTKYRKFDFTSTPNHRWYTTTGVYSTDELDTNNVSIINSVDKTIESSKLRFTQEPDQLVWCPRTSNSTWIARSRGTISITGNTFGGLDSVGYPLNSEGAASFAALSAEQQWKLFGEYIAKNKGKWAPKNGADLEFINFGPGYWATYNKAGAQPDACTTVPHQADIVQDKSKNCITYNSLKNGMDRNAENVLSLAKNSVSGSAGVAAVGNIPGAGTGTTSVGPSATDSAIFKAGNCPPPPFTQQDRIIYTGCQASITSAVPAGGTGSGYAAPGSGVASATNTSGLATIPYTGSFKPGGFIIPVADAKVTSPFGPRSSPKGGTSNHPGIDYARDQTAQQVYASADGKVIVADGKDTGATQGYGGAVYIQHTNGVVTRYGDVDNFLVKVGDIVKQGQPIAFTSPSNGTTNAEGGIDTGTHCHFEINVNTGADGLAHNPINPAPYMIAATASEILGANTSPTPPTPAK